MVAAYHLVCLSRELPIARVAVDLPLAHLDRPFDYAVTAEQDAEAVPGARVRVRFAGRLRDGFVLERCAASDHDGPLTPLHKVVSAEPVLTPEIAALIRPVADHYAGTFSDVLRLAVPPRHAATEEAATESAARPAADRPAGPLVDYPTGTGFLRRAPRPAADLGRCGRSPRARRRAGTGPSGWPARPGPAPRAAGAR